MDVDLARIAMRYKRPAQRAQTLTASQIAPSTLVLRHESPEKHRALALSYSPPPSALSLLGSPSVVKPVSSDFHFSTPYIAEGRAQNRLRPDLTLSLSPVPRREFASSDIDDSEDDPYGFAKSERQVRRKLQPPVKITQQRPETQSIVQISALRNQFSIPTLATTTEINSLAADLDNRKDSKKKQKSQEEGEQLVQLSQSSSASSDFLPTCHTVNNTAAAANDKISSILTTQLLKRVTRKALREQACAPVGRILCEMIDDVPSNNNLSKKRLTAAEKKNLKQSEVITQRVKQKRKLKDFATSDSQSSSDESSDFDGVNVRTHKPTRVRTQKNTQPVASRSTKAKTRTISTVQPTTAFQVNQEASTTQKRVTRRPQKAISTVHTIVKAAEQKSTKRQKGNKIDDTVQEKENRPNRRLALALKTKNDNFTIDLHPTTKTKLSERRQEWKDIDHFELQFG